uniref:Tenascin C n=1 Tax=Salarias fasciatus TaxID=181472 RepID=A0A672H1T7_SALFA
NAVTLNWIKQGFVLGCLTVVLLLHLSTAGLVKKVIRHRREALMPKKTQENLTLPHPDQPVVFNHVYNINVPSTSLCSVDLDSPGSADLKHKSAAPADMPSTEHMDHTLDGENQIVFTHRINIPKQACGCEHQLPDIKDILSRLEMLESELSSLREQCGSGAGCCGAPVTGTTETCSCVCEAGWKGPNCTEPECPNDCQDQGRCVDGRCECFEGYSGEDCSKLTCPKNCNERGHCFNGKCICDPGFEGEDCSILSCPDNCSNRGQCVNGECVCDIGYEGEDCMSPPKDLNVVEVTPESVGLSWENEMRVTEYLITYVPTRPGGLELDMRVPGDQKLATIQELEPGIEYLISVYAILSNKRSVPVTARVATRELTSLGILNSLGRPETTFEQSGLGPGQEYEVKLSVVKNNMPPPTAVIDSPSQVDVRDVTDTTALVTWFQPVADVDGVSISYGPSSDPADRTVVDMSSTDTQYHLGGLSPDTQYEVTLTARKAGRSSKMTKLFAYLDAPTDLQTVELTDESITLEWRNSRAEVDNYRIKYGPLSGGEHGELLFPPGPKDSTQAKITGNTPAHSHTDAWAVRSLCTAFNHIYSALDAPRDLTVTEVTETTMTLEWKRPRAKLDSYRLVYVSADGHRAEDVVPGGAESHTLRGLTPGMLYTISISAERGRRTSVPATISAPTGQQNAMLTWRRPRADITGYILTYESSSGLTRVSPDPVLSTPFNSDASTEYSVRLQALAGPKRSRVISTVFTTTGVLYRHPRDCSQALLNGDTSSGLYTIYVSGDESQPLQVYCDMSTDGGGWIVFLRRQSGRLEFFRNWKNYTAGFGDMNDEFWLGLSNLHKITAGGQYELRVDLRDKGEAAYAQYDKFSVSEPRTRYKVHVGGYSGTAGDSMTYHHGRPFSTYDHDNDIAVTNCALSYKGAFWYKNCHRVNLMGRYGDNSHSKGVNWFHWKGHEHSIEFAEMKIRPSNFRNLEGRRKRKNTLKHRTAWWSSG